MIMSGGACEIGSVPLPNVTWLIAAIAQFDSTYGAIHPYIALFLCIAGTVMNVVTVLVLTRPSMISPVNVLLCSVAVCDVIVMTSYLVFVSHFLIGAANRCDQRDYSFSWAVFTLFHAHASVIFHSTSIWLTVSLAQIRVLTISRATSGPTTTITIRLTVVLSFATCLIMACVNIPNFLTFEIVEMAASTFLPCLLPDSTYETDDGNSTAISVDTFYENELPVTNGSVFMVLASDSDCVKLKLAFWSNGMIFKVVPCFLLTISIAALLKIIADVSHRRRSLAQVMKRKKMPKDHTTPMLVAVLSIFLIAELPQGVMSVLTGIYSRETFHQKIYLPLGNLMDLLSLINSAVNFLIYCAMSRKFRIVFLQLFIRCLPSAFFRDIDELSKIQEVYESSRTRARTADYTRSEQLALTTSHRPSAASVLISLAPREERSSYRRYGENLTVGDAGFPPIEKKSPTSEGVCSLRAERFPYAHISTQGVIPANDDEESRIEQIFISVPTTNRPISRSVSMQRGHREKRRSSNLGIFCSPRNSVELERQFQTSLRRLKKPAGINSLNPVAKLKKIFLRNDKHPLVDDPSPQRRMTTLKVETNGAGVSF